MQLRQQREREEEEEEEEAEEDKKKKNNNNRKRRRRRRKKESKKAERPQKSHRICWTKKNERKKEERPATEISQDLLDKKERKKDKLQKSHRICWTTSHFKCKRNLLVVDAKRRMAHTCRICSLLPSPRPSYAANTCEILYNRVIGIILCQRCNKSGLSVCAN